MRIAFDARYINDRYHGIGRYAFRLLEALAEISLQQNLGYHFTIYRGPLPDSRFDWQPLLDMENVRLREGPPHLYLPTEQLAWAALLRREPVDLFHSPYFVAPLLAPRRLPVVVTVHDLIFDRFPQYMPLSWSRPYYRLMMGLSLWRANAVAAVSHSTARDTAQFYPQAASKLSICLEGAEAAFSPPSDPQSVAQVRRRYGLENPYVLTVGARRPHKNLRRLVRAFARAAGSVPHELVFAGTPDERFPDEAHLEADRLSLNGSSGKPPRVRFLDWVPEADLPLLYAGADLVALPSLIEGFGLPALEAMACGAPVLAAGGSAFPEVIGDAGCLVDPLDEQDMALAISRVLGDPTLRQAMSQAGLERARLFTWRRAAVQILELYGRLRA